MRLVTELLSESGGAEFQRVLSARVAPDQPGPGGGPGSERKASRDKRSKERPEGASA